MEPVYGIDSINPMTPVIIEMIRDKYGSVVKVDSSVEVMQDEVSGKPGIVPPERIWNPGIKVIVIWRRSIVSDYRRSLIVIIVVYYRSFGITGTLAKFMCFTGCISSDFQTNISFSVLKPLQCLILTH